MNVEDLLHELEDLRAIGNSLFHCQTVEKIFEVATKEIQYKLNPQAIALFSISKENFLQRKLISGVDSKGRQIETTWFSDEKYKLGESFSGKAAISAADNPYGKTNFSNNLDQDINKLSNSDAYINKLGFLKCGISVPLNGVQKTFGTLEVINRVDSKTKKPSKDLTFSKEDVYWLTIMGGHVANAISRLRRQWEAKIVSDISFRLADPKNERISLHSAYKLIADNLVHNFMPYKVCILRLTFDDYGLPVVATSKTEDINWAERDDQPIYGQGKAIVTKVFKSGKYQVVKDIKERIDDFINIKWIQSQSLKSYICFPLLMKGKVIGTISLFTGHIHEFTKSDISFLENISFLLAAFKIIDEQAKEEEFKIKNPVSSVSNQKNQNDRKNNHRNDYEETVIKCLQNKNYDFRTIEGIYRETGIPKSQIVDILQNSPYVRKSLVTDKEGNSLFTHRRKHIRFREFLALTQRIVASKRPKYNIESP